MKKSSFHIPEGSLTPEETARLEKLKIDYAAYDAQYDDDEDEEWNEQAADLGLEVRRLSPDELQFIEMMSKKTRANEFDHIEGIENVKKKDRQMAELAHLTNEMDWFRDILSRNQVTLIRNLAEDVKIVLKAAKEYQLEHPDDDENRVNVVEWSEALEELTMEGNTIELELAAKREQSAN